MEKMQIEAVYENGVLKLPYELPLQDGQTVTITIRPNGSAADRMYGIIPWGGDAEDLHRFLSDPDEGTWGNRDV